MKPAKLTTVVVVALVALRLGCGWLFYREGSKKLDSDSFTSTQFLRGAKGPLAGLYVGMIPDPYGTLRQDYTYTEDYWERYYNNAAGHFNFDEEQLDEAETAYHRALAKLKFYLGDTEEEREENLRQWDRVQQAKNNATAGVNYRRTWIEQKEDEINAELQGWLRDIDEIWDSYEKDINDIARGGMLDLGGGKSMSQHQYYGHYPLPPPGARGITSGFADTVIPWFTFGVGALLVLGLFTRVAALGGSLFLLSVVGSQPPFVASAEDINYQIVLLLALLVVAAVGAGRWGGLDFFLRWGWSKCCGGTRAAPADNESREEK